MSNKTREINKITTTIISISLRLIVYALVILLLYEAVVRGFAFGHAVFYAESVEEAPGRDITVILDEGDTVSDAARALAGRGLIKGEFAFLFQSKFYDYDTIYPGTYTLNTSMTSKEILQLLNEKPEEAMEAQSGKTKAITPKAAESKAGVQAASQNAEGQNTAGQNANDQNTAGQNANGQNVAGQNAAGQNANGQNTAGQNVDGQNADGAAAQDGAIPEGADSSEQDYQQNEETYPGEDQEVEGGWIEDVAEDAVP